MLDPAPALRCALAGLVLVGLTDCRSAAKRRFNATCGDSAECDSGLCWEGLCTKSCTISGDCGTGVCIEKVCKPIDRVECKANADCEKASPSNGCRAAVCAAGKCAFTAPVAGVVCGTKCEAGQWFPGQCTDGQCLVSKNPAPVTCNDNNACTEDSCAATTGCTYAELTAVCDDNDACTAGDVCAKGACTPGALQTCADGNACTDDSCDKGKGCVFSANTATCDDGDACTTDDKCDGEKCVPGAPLFCDNSKPCLTPSCDKLKGCVFAPNAGLCDDSEPCTVSDACLDGACTGKPDTCDDGNACTTNSCVKGSGCVSSFANGPCNDGNPCTTADVCGSGQCFGTQTACDDKVPCTIDSCDNAKGGCLHQPDNAQCNGNNCVVGTCDATKGCTSVVVPNGTLCNQNDPCSVNSHCQAGLCTVITSKKCSDNDPCTADSCDPGLGCQFAPTLSGPCDDGNACTKDETCQAGACVPPGPVAVCDDTNPCTEDKCDLGKGCVHTPINANCDDLDPCSVNDNCSTGKCAGSKTLWTAKPAVGAPYQAEAVAVAGGQIGLVGYEEASTNNVKGRVTVFDLNGNQKWQSPANASGIERPIGIVGLNGMWYVSGEAKASAAGVSQGFVRQYGADGTLGWVKAVQSGSNPVVLRGITVSGSTVCAVGKVGEGATAKTMVARYNQGGGDLGNAELFIDDSNESSGVAGYPANQGFAFAGRASKGLDSKALVGRLTEGGQIQWKVTLTESTAVSSGFHSVAVVGNDILVAGDVDLGGTPQVYVARLDGNGNKMWSKILTPFSASHAGGIAVNGNWIVVAVWGQFVGQDAGTVLLDVFGNQHDAAATALGGDQKLFGLAPVGDGTFVMHGTTTDVGQPVDITLARVNAYMDNTCAGFSQCSQLKGNVCDDSDPCTQDSCTPSNGCAFKPFADGTVCAAGKTCITGSCQP